jgi:hypothetical protein
MMEVRSGIRKTPFFGIINPKKMINRIFYLNNPPNDPSSSEYSLKRLFNFETVNLYPTAGYLTLRQGQVKTVLPICNPPITAKIPQIEPQSAFTLLESPNPTKISPPLSPQPPSNSWRVDLEMAPKRPEKDGKKEEAPPPTGEWSHNKCSNNDLQKLVSKGLLQEKSLVNWRPSFRDPIPMENMDEIVTFYHFAERGLALPSCSFFQGLLYYYGLELHHLNPNFICHIAIFIHSVKPSSESNPIGIFSASFSE